MNNESEDGYKLTYKDYELSKILRRKLRNTDLLSVKVTADTDHDITAELCCFASRDVDTGYLYRLMGNGFEYVSTVSIRNGDARIPVTESGVYVVTSQAIADVTMGINTASENVVPIVGGKLIPLSALVDLVPGDYFLPTKVSTESPEKDTILKKLTGDKIAVSMSVQYLGSHRNVRPGDWHLLRRSPRSHLWRRIRRTI